MDMGSVWHLLNFVTFQVGIIAVYFLCLRLMNYVTAIIVKVLFSSQPLLWGHSFINSKDIPFLVFFSLSVWSGLEMVDAYFKQVNNNKRSILLLISSCLLGLTTSMRVLGPFS